MFLDMVLEKFELNLFAEYHQFYLQDEQEAVDIASKVWTKENIYEMPNPWTEENAGDLLGVLPKEISIGTARNMTVPVTVEIHNNEPNEDLTDYDHVTECSFEVPSGKVVVAGCADSLSEATIIRVTPGTYRARIFYSNLDSLDERGLEGDDEYKVVLWPSEAVRPQVLKRRVEK